MGTDPMLLPYMAGPKAARGEHPRPTRWHIQVQKESLSRVYSRGGRTSGSGSSVSRGNRAVVAKPLERVRERSPCPRWEAPSRVMSSVACTLPTRSSSGASSLGRHQGVRMRTQPAMHR